MAGLGAWVMAPAICVPRHEEQSVCQRETTAKHKKINSLLNTIPKDWGWKLWVGVLRLPRRVEDGKGLDCCRGQEREKARRGPSPLDKDGVPHLRRSGFFPQCNLSFPLLAGLNFGTPSALDSCYVDSWLM